MEYSPLVWSGAAACYLSRLDRIQRRALFFLGPGVIVDSLELRRTISCLCLLYKLMCGPRSPCLLPILPRHAHHTTHPRTRQQAEASSGHNLQFSLTLPPPDQTTPSSALSPTHSSEPGTPCHPPFYTNSPIFAISSGLKPQPTAIYERRTGFGPHKPMSNTFSACFSPY